MRVLTKFISLVVVWIAIAVLYFYQELGFGTTLNFNDQSCELVASDQMFGSEDLALYKNGIVLVTSGDMHNTFHGHDPHPGAIFAIDVTSSPPAIHRLPVSGLPAGVAFQPHGFFFSNTTSKIYTVSHGLAKAGGSRVIVFRLIDNDGALAIEYERSVTSPLFRNGGLNDVVETRDGEVASGVFLLGSPCLLRGHCPCGTVGLPQGCVNRAGARSPFSYARPNV